MDLANTIAAVDMRAMGVDTDTNGLSNIAAHMTTDATTVSWISEPYSQ